MMTSPSDKNLERFYQFFEKYGTERLNGLDESYFVDLNVEEKKEAWDFLAQGDFLSEERIKGLYILDKERAITLFKDALTLPLKNSAYPEQRQAFERSRLLSLMYIYSSEPDEKYVTAMSQFSSSEFAEVRGQFAQCLPSNQITPEALQALKGMVLAETERVPRTLAITKLMLLFGMDFDMDDPEYKSIYLSLRMGNPQEKLLTMKKLERRGTSKNLGLSDAGWVKS